MPPDAAPRHHDLCSLRALPRGTATTGGVSRLHTCSSPVASSSVNVAMKVHSSECFKLLVVSDPAADAFRLLPLVAPVW